MKSVEIIMIPVKDRERAKAYYESIGFKLIVEAPDPHGSKWIQMGLPGRSTSLSLADFPAVICETDDIEKEVSDLQAKGIEVGKIDDTPWGRFAWLKDPDGNGLCLHQRTTD